MALRKLRRRRRPLAAFLLVLACAAAGVGRLQHVAGQASSLSHEVAKLARKADHTAAAVKSGLINQTRNRANNVGVWCDAINQGRDYERQYFRSTVRQTQAEARLIERAIAKPRAHGLTRHQASFIRTYLDSVVALEREVPRVLSLHPYMLADLPCRSLEQKTLASTKPSKP